MVAQKGGNSTGYCGHREAVKYNKNVKIENQRRERRELASIPRGKEDDRVNASIKGNRLEQRRNTN